MTTAGIEAIAAHLLTAGVAGGSSGWTLSLGRYRDGPKDVAVLDAGGPGPLVQPERFVENGSYQIQVRGTNGDDKTARDKAEEALRALCLPGMPFFNHLIPTQSGALSIGPDQGGRPLMSVNLRGQGAGPLGVRLLTVTLATGGVAAAGSDVTPA